MMKETKVLHKLYAQPLLNKKGESASDICKEYYSDLNEYVVLKYQEEAQIWLLLSYIHDESFAIPDFYKHIISKNPKLERYVRYFLWLCRIYNFTRNDRETEYSPFEYFRSGENDKFLEKVQTLPDDEGWKSLTFSGAFSSTHFKLWRETVYNISKRKDVKDNIRLELACSELRKKIQVKANDRSFYTNSSSSLIDPFPDQRSPITNTRSVRILDTLTVLLDEIEKGQYGSPATILVQVKDELDNYNEFPHRSPEPLLALALRTYSYQSSSELQNAILALIYQLNTICDPFILLKIYLQMPTSLQFQGVPSDLIERCYKDFLDRRREELDRTPTYPETLFSNFSRSNNSTSSFEKEVKNINPKDIDSRLDVEFKHLLDWDTAYVAVCAIWELIGRYKNEEIRDLLMTKYDELEYAPKSFLVQGLRELEDQNPRSEDSEMTIRQMEDYFNYAMKPNMGQNATFSARSSSPRVPSRPYQSEPQKMTPTLNSSSRYDQSPQDQSLKRKRMTSNGASLKTGYKTNH